mmetsp:Transcript_9978/g.21974  ORF Transcript_9978/g.21974 Transcript_9978/m.21974 type:complete len:516 (+) Transcript_9978:117-1664(+)|eukprot:CAMPEP_0204265540 /NCGR_PEP_ID=MMETSP0468-20130131/9743_1 /ASSEMBLY_ACC=CAM_ASM_000383 /TAXON_ID=2969 /ORGANISM="Oxyrrhis marina" /LENGTH=515 /DNA_ID=CAMNT_0051240503 /DNA_START=124 /DNA_END=1671 /DNA_ORIENTATION=+
MRIAVCSLALGASRTWVPIEVNDGTTTFFSPELNRVVSSVPAGDTVSPTVRMPVSLLEGDDTDTGDGADTAEDGAEAHAARAVEAAVAGPTEQVDQAACYPKCSWSCTKPVCQEDCRPDCEQPKCQTRCPRPDYSKCKIDCGTPHCSVFCPKDPCHSVNGTKCSSPKCSTQCARAVCSLKCANPVPCSNICHAPSCTWKCKNPKQCNKPECKLMCEKPLGCAQSYELPPLSPALTVEKNFEADRAKWVVYEWERCTTECGKGIQTRKVVCSTGSDDHCQFSNKPATQRPCEETGKCNQWRASPWSPCDTTCGSGMRSRHVQCDNEDAKECLGPKPHSREACVDEGPHCTKCRVTLYGGQLLDGWRATFGVGDYTTDDLIRKGVKCEDVSSVKVQGECCQAHLYQYGDFNRAHDGWNASLTAGDYDVDALEAAGAQDNDVSAMVVALSGECSGSTQHPRKRRHHGMSVDSLSGSDATEVHSQRLGEEVARQFGSSVKSGAAGAALGVLAAAVALVL